MRPTLRYKIYKGKQGEPFTYDVIRIATGQSVFDEPDNYQNEEA